MEGSDLTVVAALLVGGKLEVAGSDLIRAAVVVAVAELGSCLMAAAEAAAGLDKGVACTKNSAARVIPGLTCKATASRLRSFLQNLMRSSPGSMAGAAGRAGALSASFRFMELPSSRALLSRRAGRWTGRACRICTAHNPSSGYISQALL
ncbi:MAG: hypothetical protein FRX49_11843 [Trebouxia sp. A1-2]|nr:MAG: hypothetical protein FRX49_11843 [Trebouxia sp. A1-2]